MDGGTATATSYLSSGKYGSGTSTPSARSVDNKSQEVFDINNATMRILEGRKENTKKKNVKKDGEKVHVVKFVHNFPLPIYIY
jgi:hypothetical protein